jgi:hypothetical protein
VVNQADQREKDGLSGTSFDHRRLAHTRGVEIDVCAFFCCFGFDIEIEEFDDVADKVG